MSSIVTMNTQLKGWSNLGPNTTIIMKTVAIKKDRTRKNSKMSKKLSHAFRSAPIKTIEADNADDATEETMSLDSGRSFSSVESNSTDCLYDDNDPATSLSNQICNNLLMYAGILKSKKMFDWKIRVNKPNMTVETYEDGNSPFSALRAVTIMSVNMDQLKRLLIDPSRIAEYDSLHDYDVILKHIDDHTIIKHVYCKGVWPTAPRDFIVSTTYKNLKNGGFVVATQSVDDSTWNRPHNPKYIRGQVLISGYYVKPIGDTQCKVTMIAHTELGGTIPSTIINMLSTIAPVKLLDTIQTVAMQKE